MTDIKKGLAGVVVDTTAISKVNAETNSLLYRGYPVHELAAECSFEEVAYLLWHGELPDERQLAAFQQAERAQRGLDETVKRVIDLLPRNAHPMDIVRTAVSVIGAADPEAADSSPDADLAKAVTLFAKLPAIVAYIQRRRHTCRWWSRATTSATARTSSTCRSGRFPTRSWWTRSTSR